MAIRIFLIGISGTGKTRLSKILSEKLDIPFFDLDDVFWKKKYTDKNTEIDCRKKVNKIMNNNNEWIINGTYSNWTKNVARRATQIIWLDFNKNLVTLRLIKRELTNNISKKGFSKSFISLLNYQRKYREVLPGKKISTFSQHERLILPYQSKLIHLRNDAQLKKYLKSIKFV